MYFQKNKTAPFVVLAVLFTFILTLSESSLAQATGTGSAASSKIVALFTDLQLILQAISIIAVTAGIMISGFQITFGNKRPVETIPILVGAVFVGVAAQIASFLATT
jgi:type IV secretion system protein VirB2